MDSIQSPGGSLMDLTQGTMIRFVSWEAAVDTVEYGPEEGKIGGSKAQVEG